VLDRSAVEKAADTVVTALGGVDALINGAGGNHPQATTDVEQSFFDLPAESFRFVSDLNLLGTVLPSQSLLAAWPAGKRG